MSRLNPSRAATFAVSLFAILTLLSSPLIRAGRATPVPADLILHNGFIWTVDSKTQPLKPSQSAMDALSP